MLRDHAAAGRATIWSAAGDGHVNDVRRGSAHPEQGMAVGQPARQLVQPPEACRRRGVVAGPWVGRCASVPMWDLAGYRLVD